MITNKRTYKQFWGDIRFNGNCLYMPVSGNDYHVMPENQRWNISREKNEC